MHLGARIILTPSIAQFARYRAGMKHQLLLPDEVDRLLRYPPGRSERLARRGKLPHIQLPDGAIRFEPEAIDGIVTNRVSDAGEGDRRDG